MSALTSTFNGVATMGWRALFQPMNQCVIACSRTGCALFLFVLLLASQARAAQSPAANVSTQFQQVQSLIQQGSLEEARTKTLDLLQQNPSSVEGYNLLGIIKGNEQDYPGAIAAFQKALQLAPNSTRTHNNLGNIYVAQKRGELAEKEFRTVLRLDPANRDANYNLGVLLMMKGVPAEAIPHFERVRPANLATRFNLIRAYFQTRRTADALRLATELSAQSSSDVQVHFSLALLLASEKQYKPARLELEKADALQPETFEILYNLGQVLLRSGDSAGAELALSRALKLKPDSVETMYLLAQARTNQSRPLDALDLLLRAHKLAPQNPDVIFLMAQVSMSQNYFEDAIPLLESGIQVAPQRPDLRAALGESYFMAGKVDKAIEQFKQLLALEHSARSLAFLGLSYRNLGRFDEAKQYFQQGLKLDPGNTLCLFNLGYIAERQGDSAAAEAMFQQALHYNPNFPDALLELANLRVVEKKFPEAEDLLRRYVQFSHDPATGYYKLAMVERALHKTAAADRDLNVFKTLSKNASDGPYPYQHLFDYLDNRSRLAPGARNQLDLTELLDQVKTHPDQPENLYLLAQAYLKSGDIENAQSTIAQLDKLSAGDFRTLTGTGVLLARFHLYDAAIQHFQAALQANPNSDDVKFDLANAYFKMRQYPQALDTAEQVSAEGRNDNAYLALLGDIYVHLGDTARADEIFRDAITRNPDNDQEYLSLALLEFRQNNIAAARQTLLKGQARIPGSGKLYWGLGLASALQGDTAQAAQQFEHAVELLPEWPGAYSTLGVFYFETGQIDKAREILDRFKNSSANGSLDINRIEQVLAQAPASSATGNEAMTMANRAQLLQLALSLADRTL
ncbi:MAG: tetratricopeptide repeat protein [Acidobacteriota bacterium]|nr:tetratricopeptide repeat protein [Acidobacteriota bacterium]